MLLESVLVIDDDEATRYILRRLLSRGKITQEVYEATDGDEGLDLLAEAPFEGTPSLIFLDINMPRVNGFEVLERLEALRAQGHAVPVIVMCSSSNRESEHKAAMAYPLVKGFVVKMPRSAKELREAIVRSLELEAA